MELKVMINKGQKAGGGHFREGTRAGVSLKKWYMG